MDPPALAQTSNDSCLGRKNVPVAWVGFPPGPPEPGTFAAGTTRQTYQDKRGKLTRAAADGEPNADLGANRMSPQGLGALFRLGAPKPGHLSRRCADVTPQFKSTSCQEGAPPGRDVWSAVWTQPSRKVSRSNRMPILGLGGFSAWPAQARAFFLFPLDHRAAAARNPLEYG